MGRNITLFDTTRHWGHRAIKRYWDGSYTDWAETVYAYADNKNMSIIADEWGAPLPELLPISWTEKLVTD